jgi:hypothetical protein
VCSSQHGIKDVKSGKIMWVEHVTRIRGSRNMHKIWVVKPKGKISLRILSVERKMGAVLTDLRNNYVIRTNKMHTFYINVLI